MILRKIYWKTGLKNESLFFFLCGLVFAFTGIIVSRLIFSQNIGLVAVFLTSLASISLVEKEIAISEILLGRILRYPNKIVMLEEIITIQHQITLKSIYHDHRKLFHTYFYLFLGIMTCFFLVTISLPLEQSQILFGEQFKISSPKAITPLETFGEIFLNNFLVLTTGFFLALIFQLGTTFIIVWNASVWGASLAIAAKKPFYFFSTDPLIDFLATLFVFFPHLSLEIISYFSSTIAGGLLNKTSSSENFNSIRFKIITLHAQILLMFGVITLFAAALIETGIIVWIK